MNIPTELQNLTIYDLLNSMVAKIPNENPVDYFDKMYDVINPGMVMEAVEEAKRIIEIESETTKKSKKKKYKSAEKSNTDCGRNGKTSEKGSGSYVRCI